VKDVSFISTIVWLDCKLRVPLLMLTAEHLISLWNFMIVLYLFLRRLSKLLREIGVERGNKMIIFVETKKKVDDITKAIRREG
jgi:hypothetical protein